MSAPWRGYFWPLGNNLNNLGRGPLGEVMYPISKAWAFCFQTRRFLKFFPIWVYVKQVTPGAGPFLTPGYNLNNFGRGPLEDIPNIKDLGLLVSDKKIL